MTCKTCPYAAEFRRRLRSLEAAVLAPKPSPPSPDMERDWLEVFAEHAGPAFHVKQREAP